MYISPNLQFRMRPLRPTLRPGVLTKPGMAVKQISHRLRVHSMPLVHLGCRWILWMVRFPMVRLTLVSIHMLYCRVAMVRLPRVVYTYANTKMALPVEPANEQR